MLDTFKISLIRALLAEGNGIRTVARTAGVSRNTVRRYQRNTPRKTRHGPAWRALEANREMVEKLFHECDDNCAALLRALEGTLDVLPGLRTLQHFCKSLRESPRRGRPARVSHGPDSIEAQFNLISEEYDRNRRKFIPCFDDFYAGTTKFLASGMDKPRCVVDLGAGTGLLTSCWYRFFPEADYVLVDMADEMLNVAGKRFAGLRNVSFRTENYIDALPDVPFDTVISALSVHHLEDADKARLFERIHEALPQGGLFVNYDQFRAGTPEMNQWFDSYWENGLLTSGLSEGDIIRWREHRKLDRECSVEQEVRMLTDCGFDVVECVYANLKFAVIAAVK